MSSKPNSKANLKTGLAGIITGASSGIGKALAIDLAKKYKANLVISARNEELLKGTADLINAAGGQACVVAGDISKKEMSDRLVSTCLNQFGSVDLLINNAGLAKPGPLNKLTVDDWRFVFDVNFFGALYATYAVLPHFMAQNAGKIVNIASIAGKISFPGSVCYAASKFALTGMSEGMAAELAASSIDVITVCPGWVRTEFFTNVKLPEKRNPTLIAEKKNLKGWLMRNYLSMSVEEASSKIIEACEEGGSHEIILTALGVVLERMQGLFPSLVSSLAKRYPADRD